MIRVTALYIHPIKGCAGVGVTEARLTPRGFENDRRWMVVDAGVWEHQGSAIEHVEGSDWISRYLGAPHALVYMPDEERRPVSSQHGRSGDIVSFADGYPLLLISLSSLEDLNARLDVPIAMGRFRPNLVVEGCGSFAEDGWKTFRIGTTPFRTTTPCSRCAVTTVDPATAQTGVEPLRTLATFRKWDGKVWFGMNVVPDGGGAIRVGDLVEPA